MTMIFVNSCHALLGVHRFDRIFERIPVAASDIGDGSEEPYLQPAEGKMEIALS